MIYNVAGLICLHEAIEAIKVEGAGKISFHFEVFQDTLNDPYCTYNIIILSASENSKYSLHALKSNNYQTLDLETMIKSFSVKCMNKEI